MYSTMSVQKLAPTNWTYAQIPSAELPISGATEWNRCSQFPTEIHLELRGAGKIPDWNKGRAEHDIQCESAHTLFQVRCYGGNLANMLRIICAGRSAIPLVQGFGQDQSADRWI